MIEATTLPAPTVLFDLDGTLADTAPDLAAAANQALIEAGHRPAPEAELRALVGRGGRRLIGGGLAYHGCEDVDEDEMNAIVAAFLRLYVQRVGDAGRPYPGIDALLRRLHDDGVSLGVCTNKPEVPARKLIALCGWDRLFGVVVGGDGRRPMKPDPHPLIDAVEDLGGDLEGCLMIGDSRDDFEAARAAGVAFALVDFGYDAAAVDERSCDAVFVDYRKPPQRRGGADHPALAALMRAYR